MVVDCHIRVVGAPTHLPGCSHSMLAADWLCNVNHPECFEDIARDEREYPDDTSGE
jgi:hypothetical protein